MADTHHILLSPESSPYHTADSVVITADCGHRAWIAPTSMTAHLSPFMATRTTCMRCVSPKDLREAIATGNLRAVPGAKDELAAEVGPELADQVYRQMGVNEDPL